MRGADKEISPWFWMLIGAIIAFAFFMSIGAAFAHSWYPIGCCSDNDCRPLDETKGETVEETAKGFKLWDGRIILKAQVKTSPDGKYHLCEGASHNVICFYAPPGST